MNDKTAVIIFEPRGDTFSKGKKKSPTGDRQSQQECLQAMLAGSASSPDVEVILAPYLVDLSPHGPVMSRLQARRGRIIAIAPLRARAIHWLLVANGLEAEFVELPAVRGKARTAESHSGNRGKSKAGRTVYCLDLRDEHAIAVCSTCLDETAEAAGDRSESSRRTRASKPMVLGEETSQRWYPLVDRDCCRNCLECLNFCLFGVYGLDENGRLTVEQADACRPGCPACSRVCPHHAIIFPEHSDPAISGDLSAWKQERKKGGKKKDLDRLVEGLNELDG